MQHAFRTTVLGLSQFKWAANFDVIFFPSHCLKPLALFIIRALWSEQHGNNVSRRHTPSDGPLTALRHLCLSFLSLSLPLSSLVPLFAVSILYTYSIQSLPLLPAFSLIVYDLKLLLTPTPSCFFIFFLSLYLQFDRTYLPLPYWFSSTAHVWPLISNSTTNWTLISGWLIQQGSY